MDAAELVAELVRRNVLRLSRLRALVGLDDRGTKQGVDEVDVRVGGGRRKVGGVFLLRE